MRDVLAHSTFRTPQSCVTTLSTLFPTSANRRTAAGRSGSTAAAWVLPLPPALLLLLLLPVLLLPFLSRTNPCVT